MKSKTGAGYVCVLFATMLMCFFLFTTDSPAQGKTATPAQAKEQVKKMVDYVKKVGCDKAFAEFAMPKSAWNTDYENLYAVAT